VAVCGNDSPWCDTLPLRDVDLVERRLKMKEWTAAMVEKLRVANGLEVLAMEAPEGMIPLGVLARRGRRSAVIWARRKRDDIETLARGIRSRLEGMNLVVIVPPGTQVGTDRVLAGPTVLLAPPIGSSWDLQLWRALDLLDPSYRERRIADPVAIFDDVALEFATVPGKRHIVRLNGHELGGFQRSDLKFLRLLLLAVVRHVDPDVDGGGWIKSQGSRLLGPFPSRRPSESLRSAA